MSDILRDTLSDSLKADLKASVENHLKGRLEAISERLQAHSWHLNLAYPIRKGVSTSDPSFVVREEAMWFMDEDPRGSVARLGRSIPGDPRPVVVREGIATQIADKAEDVATGTLDKWTSAILKKIALRPGGELTEARVVSKEGFSITLEVVLGGETRTYRSRALLYWVDGVETQFLTKIILDRVDQ